MGVDEIPQRIRMIRELPTVGYSSTQKSVIGNPNDDNFTLKLNVHPPVDQVRSVPSLTEISCHHLGGRRC